MTNIERSPVPALFALVGGLALVFLSHVPSVAAQTTLATALEAIGFALTGYAPIRLIMFGSTLVSDRGRRKAIDWLFTKPPRAVKAGRGSLPKIIASDLEGCITPAGRTELDLRKIQRLRSYCDFLTTPEGKAFPPIIIYTGRGQGYAELTAQSLGIVKYDSHLPLVIENGAALYYPHTKKTVCVLTPEQRSAIRKLDGALREELPGNEFEPKAYMITLNPMTGQNIEELRKIIEKKIEEMGQAQAFIVNNSMTAVDITPAGVSKLSAMQKIAENLEVDPKSIVAIGDSVSDIPVMTWAGSAYCPAFGVDRAVVDAVNTKHSDGSHIIHGYDIDFVVEVVERVCGLRLP